MAGSGCCANAEGGVQLDAVGRDADLAVAVVGEANPADRIGWCGFLMRLVEI